MELRLSGGVGDWLRLCHLDYPLPEALATVLGQDSRWTKFFAIIGYLRQVFTLTRASYLPAVLARLNSRQTPHRTLVAGGAVGVLALLTGTTAQVIILSVLEALVYYNFLLSRIFLGGLLGLLAV